MRFLGKGANSATRTMRYRPGGHNERLLEQLLTDQCGFCAYSEAHVNPLHTAAVEHFDPALKGTDADGPLNWYGVLQKVNQRKRRSERLFDATLLGDRWFQVPGAVAERVVYDSADHMFFARNPDDAAAKALIDYLGFNHSEVVIERKAHVERLRSLFGLARLEGSAALDWLADHRAFLAFPSALEASLGLEVDVLLGV
ncbi:MAG: hypothetical protein R3F61_16085 [Myxococcota bacterium]